MRIGYLICTGLLVLAMAGIAGAQEAELAVERCVAPQWAWGEQQVEVTVSNSADWVKFLKVNIEVEFIGGRYECLRRSVYNAYLEPMAKATLKPKVSIPGNYGDAVVRMVFHNVIDTMDAILPGQKFATQTLNLNIPRPEGMSAWENLRTALPPRIDEHPYFDNEFSRVLFHFLHEGKTVEEIAAVTGASLDNIAEQLQMMTLVGFIVEKEGQYHLTFPLILDDEARVAVALADSTAQVLSEKIAGNMPRYRPVLDSLIAAGAVSKDSSSIFETTGYLYHPYVVVAVMLLWYDMGHKFVSSGSPFVMYRNMDICNALNARYMYATPDEEGYNGHHFYTFLIHNTSFQLMFTDQVPEVDCGTDFLIGKRLKKKAMWKFADGSKPDFFMIDSTAARPLLDILGAGCWDVVTEAQSGLEKVAIEAGHDELSPGHRYWFWNLVSSRILDRLVTDGVVEKYKRGQYTLAQALGN